MSSLSADGRDWAVRDYRTHLQAVLKRSPATVNNALVAVDDFYIRRGLGPASAARVEIAATAPRALDQRAQLRYLREVQRCPSPRDQALALVPFYAGARISEIVALDVDDVPRSRAQRRPADPRQRPTRPPCPDPPAAARRPRGLA
jgi:integrase/recombinase XerC